jgi:hypothetical protein
MIPSLIRDAAWLLTIIVVPAGLFAWLVHLMEWLMQRRLSSRFGWNSVLWTGWLGTPVHELSHALLCVVFRHEIVDMALFKPDKSNRRLGYVVHAWQQGNLIQDIGSFFIGIAPLIGGTLVLFGLLLLFFPHEGQTALFVHQPESPFATQVTTAVSGLIRGLFQPQNLLSFRLWLFLYLVICVGSHMAPSGDDYRGALKGGVITGLLLAVVCLIAAATGIWNLQNLGSRIMVPVVAILLTVVLLCALATAVIWLITGIVDRVRRRA